MSCSNEIDVCEFDQVVGLPIETRNYIPSTILLTGGAGFIGSNVVNYISSAYPEYSIIVLDKLDRCASLKNLKNNKNINFVKGDICDSALVYSVLQEKNVDTIMHFAAQSHVDNSFGDSLSFTEANVLGTHVLLEAAKSLGSQIKRFIHVSTDEVYGEQSENDARCTEESRQNPTNPYAATKSAAETIIQSYIHSFKLPVIITRSNNVYGPRQYPEKLIPKFIQRLRLGLSATIHGSGTNRRSYLFSRDVAAAFDVILHRGETHHIYNIGSDEEYENIDVFHKLLKIMKAKGYCQEANNSYVEYVRDRAFNDFRYHITTDSLQKLGWKRQVKLERGLESTVDWYLKHGVDHWSSSDIDSAIQAHPHFPVELKAGPIPKQLEARQTLASVDDSKDNKRSNSIDLTFKWLLYGTKGWIGHQFKEYLKILRPDDEIFDDSVLSRADNDAGVESDIVKFKPNRVVSLIGRLIGPGFNNVDYLEQKGKLTENVRDNLYAPISMAIICQRKNVHFTYLGTGCIFTHDEAHPKADHEKGSDAVGFSEDDKPNFYGATYSIVKGFTDRLLHQFASTSLNVRIRLPLNGLDEPRNLLSKLIRYQKIANADNSITVLNELLPIMIRMIVQKEVGSLNLCNPGTIDHNEILSIYRELINPDHKWEVYTVEEQNKVLAAERCNVYLTTDRLQKFEPRVRNVKDAVRHTLALFKQNKDKNNANSIQPYTYEQQ